MADYKDRFEQWQRTAKEKFEEIDKQLGLKERIEESAKAVKEATQKGAENFKESVDKLKSEVEKTEAGKQAVKVAEDTYKTAEDTAKKVYEASAPVRDAAENVGGKAADAFGVTAVEAEKVVKEAGKKAGEVFSVAGEKASEVFEDASASFKKTGKAAADIFNFGAGWTRTFNSAVRTFQRTTGWIQENPLQAATTGVSMIVGAGLGAGFTLVSSNWLFQSALPAWSVKKISEQFTGYLENQEELIKKGELSKAEAERIEFERDIVKYAGAPLLGAFSCAAGAMMWANMFNPKTITGAPISWLLGGNPVLEGVWLFGNGLVCFKIGYEFFMVSLEDHEDVQKIVKEIKGLLPIGQN